jgi:hypothetical protein
MADIFQEVEEGLRQDRYQVLLRRYGPTAAALITAVILGVAGREAWIALKARAAARSSDAFLAAEAELDAGRTDAALAAFGAHAENGARSYSALAKMQEAAAAADEGSVDEAVALYDEAASQMRDPLLRDLARLKAAYLVADRVDVATLEARLEPVMKPDAPYELVARELLGAAALEAGDLAKAREAYSYLTVALGAPGGVQRRAQEALAVIDAAEAASGSGEEG